MTQSLGTLASRCSRSLDQNKKNDSRKPYRRNGPPYPLRRGGAAPSADWDWLDPQLVGLEYFLVPCSLMTGRATMFGLPH